MRGNPPELQARSDAAKERLQARLRELREAKSQDGQDAEATERPPLRVPMGSAQSQEPGGAGCGAFCRTIMWGRRRMPSVDDFRRGTASTFRRAGPRRASGELDWERLARKRCATPAGHRIESRGGGRRSAPERHDLGGCLLPAQPPDPRWRVRWLLPRCPPPLAADRRTVVEGRFGLHRNRTNTLSLPWYRGGSSCPNSHRVLRGRLSADVL